jgi:hypothetical protein
MRRLLPLLAAVAAVAALAAPAFAATKPVNVPSKFKKLIPKVKQKSGIAVEIPSRLRAGVKPSRVFGNASARKNKWRLELGVGHNCGGGNACFVAAFWPTRPSTPARADRLTHAGHAVR